LKAVRKAGHVLKVAVANARMESAAREIAASVLKAAAASVRNAPNALPD
jgi:uncharacterized protein with PhoU and TrkA domain